MIRKNGTNGTVVAPPPIATKRMTLEAIQEADTSGAEKIVLYAPEGWGKSTWASNFENPVFLSTEEGLKGVYSIEHKPPKSFPEPRTWKEVFEAVETLRVKN